MHRSMVAAALAAIVPSFAVQAACAASNDLPLIDHVVVVVLENHSFDQIIDPHRAPFIYHLATDGALFVNAFAVSHPSQPNYFALFSGSTQGISDNEDHTFDEPTLAGALNGAGKSFVGYVETGSPRKHNPWESFVNARATERNFSEFPRDFTRLPTISFVIPDLNHDMHDGSVRVGDTWLKVHFGGYAEWAKTYNSLLIITFDEDDNSAKNRIPTIIYGAHVRPGEYAEYISHYSLLRTLLALYGLIPFAEAATTPPTSPFGKNRSNAGTLMASSSKRSRPKRSVTPMPSPAKLSTPPLGGWISSLPNKKRPAGVTAPTFLRLPARLVRFRRISRTKPVLAGRFV